MTLDPGPVAIGGVGGSGTRVVASIVRELGYYIGDDLNGANDNLWFTLLFKRRSVLVDTDQRFRQLYAIFAARMSGALERSDDVAALVRSLAAEERLQHSQDWLDQRAQALLHGASTRAAGQPWAWKEPNTHVVLERLLGIDDRLRYLHVVRNPLYMAQGSNRNQLENWGPVFLSRKCDPSSRDALAYWCSAHRRLLELQSLHPDRIEVVNFDRLCEAPHDVVSSIAGFLGRDVSPSSISAAAALVREPLPRDSGSGSPATDVDERDLDYVRSIWSSVAFGPAAA